jgi:hypothetical protein
VAESAQGETMTELQHAGYAEEPVEQHRLQIHGSTFNCGRNVSITPAIHIAGRIDTAAANCGDDE